MTAIVNKSPGDHLDFDTDFSIWLASDDRIISATSSIANGSATISKTEHSDQVVKVWIRDGAEGETNEVTVTATTHIGRTKTYCFNLKIRKAC